MVSALFAAAVLSAVGLLVWYDLDMRSNNPVETEEIPTPAVQANVDEPTPSDNLVETEAIPTAEPHIVMPTKSSRPGCEEDSLCYIPDVIAAEAGQTIIWRNIDVAFHSVTSGAYGEPDGLFDSGHMDPGDTFSYTFGESGTYRYHCTLHPWMAGVIHIG